MRGPIIKEHLTNATIGYNKPEEFYVKHDGRIMRVFVKGEISASIGSGGVTVTLLPVAHFSDSKPSVLWPQNSSPNSDYLVYPPNGSLTFTSGGSFSGCILTTEDGDFSEYFLQFVQNTKDGSTPAVELDVTNVYLVTESA